jgi:hypothetical protein
MATTTSSTDALTVLRRELECLERRVAECVDIGNPMRTRTIDRSRA